MNMVTALAIVVLIFWVLVRVGGVFAGVFLQALGLLAIVFAVLWLACTLQAMSKTKGSDFPEKGR